MPGVLIVEALQVGAVALLSAEESPGNWPLCRDQSLSFQAPGSPRDRLELGYFNRTARWDWQNRSGSTRVDGQVVASGELMFALVDRDEGTLIDFFPEKVYFIIAGAKSRALIKSGGGLIDESQQPDS